MKNEEYKKLSISEFTKAAGRYESNHAGIYEMCKKDYPDILEELEKEPCRDVLDAGCGPAPMVSYDGFDPNEKTEFYSMEDECEKIEQEIRTKYGGRIKAAYGCSLGGSFVSLLIQRKRIHIDHGIIGSSDMDDAGSFMAKLQLSIIVPIMYKMVHTGKLPKFMQKKMYLFQKSGYPKT